MASPAWYPSDSEDTREGVYAREHGPVSESVGIPRCSSVDLVYVWMCNPCTHSSVLLLHRFDWELTDAEMQQLDAATKPPVAGDPDGSSGDCKVL